MASLAAPEALDGLQASGSMVDVFRGTGQHAEQLRFVNGGA